MLIILNMCVRVCVHVGVQAVPAHHHHAQRQLRPRGLHLQVWENHLAGQRWFCRTQRPADRALHLRNQRTERHRAEGQETVLISPRVLITWLDETLIHKCYRKFKNHICILAKCLVTNLKVAPGERAAYVSECSISQRCAHVKWYVV